MEPWLKPGIRTREFVVRMIGRYKGTFAVLAVVTIVASLGNAVDAYIIRELVNILSSATMSVSEKTNAAFWWIGILFATMIATMMLWRLSTWLGIRSQPNISREARLELYEYARRHSHRYWNDHFAGALANKISTAGRGVSDIFDMITWNFLMQITVFCYTIAFFYFMHASIASVMLLFAGVFFVFFYFFGAKIQRLSKARADARSISHGKLVDSVTNIWNIISFTGGERERAMLDEQFRVEQAAQVRAWWYQDWVRAGQMVLVWSVVVGLMGYSVHLWSQGLITVGDIAIVFTLSSTAARQIRELSQALLQFFERASDVQDALDTLVVPYDITDAAGALPLLARTGTVEFDAVDFRYRDGLPLVFEDLSLTIPSGQRIGLVGRSGAGKTTLVAIIQRLYDLSAGAIRIDGQDISQVTLDSLRSAIAVVPQDPILFHRSLWENIAYGKPGATMDEVVEAAKRANAHDFILRIPEGYDAKVGERGVKLSGGQRQRIAIARAILKDSPILILDEATSALDSESEALIQEALETLMKGRTTLVIAHRLSTLRSLDRILVFESGRIAEDGTHDSLLAIEGGVYRSLWERQAGGFIEE
jgi:ATP-binding cassette, subfamily B, bacterial